MAGPADTYDGAVRQVGLKAIAPLELICQRLEHLDVHDGLGAAAAADHVMVQRGVGPLVLGHPVVEVGVADDAQLLEHLEGAVHGRDVDVRKDAHHLLVDLVSRDVAAHGGDRVQNELALWRHAQPALPECGLQLRCRNHVPAQDPTIALMSASDDTEASGEEVTRGEILKASAPGPAQARVGMDVTTIDGHRIGRIKEIRPDEFLVDRQMARDLWIPFSAVLAAEDFTSNSRGPVQPDELVLKVSRAHIDSQGWRHA